MTKCFGFSSGYNKLCFNNQIKLTQEPILDPIHTGEGALFVYPSTHQALTLGVKRPTIATTKS